MARRIDPSCITNSSPIVYDLLGIGASKIVDAIHSCYDTMDQIDNTLVSSSIEPMAGLVEKANLSSMLGNMLGAQIAEQSAGRFVRNGPNTYPDLLPAKPGAPEVEIKVALEQNKPKGHHPKAGLYLTFRYVLAAKDGSFRRGKDTRGDTAWIYEVRLGRLDEKDFTVSNTPGDSGKTATVSATGMSKLDRIIYVKSLTPYAKG